MSQVNNDEQIIEGIKRGGIARQKAIALLYSNETLKKQVISHVTNNSGNIDDGVDMFHEGIIVLDRNVRNNKFRGEGSLNGYLFKTCNFLWKNQLRKMKKVEYTSDVMTMDKPDLINPEVISIDAERKALLQNVLGMLGEKCQKILELWKLSYSMDEIAKAADLKDGETARKRKYKCYQKLLGLLENNPSLKQQLKK